MAKKAAKKPGFVPFAKKGDKPMSKSAATRKKGC